jgi:hypothetical protein
LLEHQLKNVKNTIIECAKFENVQYKNRPVLCYEFGGFVFPGILIAHVSCHLTFCTHFISGGTDEKAHI